MNLIVTWHISILTLFLFWHSPCVCQPESFPYKLSKTDYVLLPTSVATYFAADHIGNKNKRNLSIAEISELNRNEINRFDRTATYHWSERAIAFSNFPLRTLPYLPIALGIPPLVNKKYKNVLTLGVMYAEVYFLNKGLTSITKSTVGRIRPYLYNMSFTVEERFNMQNNEAPGAKSSFFSGHSSNTFAFAVFLSKTYTDIYGKNIWSKVIWTTTLSLATATAICRVSAGVHFPTDVIVGAVVGSAIGYVVPTLHRVKDNKISFHVLPDRLSLTVKL